MEITSKLQKLPINKGLYLVLPNIKTPLFIIPLTSKWAYKKAISLIKPKTTLGNLKKKLLAEIPFFFLKRLFTIIELETAIQNYNSGQLVLPWNQDPINKFTIFNFEKEQITLFKIGFNKASKLIDNEHKCITLISEKAKDVIPKIKSYYKFEDHSILETEFYTGHHPSSVPMKITAFFEHLYKNAEEKPFKQHPYILHIQEVILNSFLNKENRAIADSIIYFANRFKEELIPIVIMHGDCSMTNVIKSGANCRIIDWEEGVIEGAPLDLTYFEFRKKIDNYEDWQISNVIDFLVVLHYFYFQIKHGNNAFLNRFEWKDKVIRIQQKIK